MLSFWSTPAPLPPAPTPSTSARRRHARNDSGQPDLGDFLHRPRPSLRSRKSFAELQSEKQSPPTSPWSPTSPTVRSDSSFGAEWEVPPVPPLPKGLRLAKRPSMPAFSFGADMDSYYGGSNAPSRLDSVETKVEERTEQLHSEMEGLRVNAREQLRAVREEVRVLQESNERLARSNEQLVGVIQQMMIMFRGDSSRRPDEKCRVGGKDLE